MASPKKQPKSTTKSNKSTSKVSVDNIKQQTEQKVNRLEIFLDEALNKNAPFKLSQPLRNWITKYLPWFSLVGGIIGLLVVMGMWNLINNASTMIDYANQLSNYTGGRALKLVRFGFFWKLSVITLAAQSVLMLLAYSKLKPNNRSKGGWNLLFYSSIFSAISVIFEIINDTRNFGGFIMGAIGVVISWYVLFQIRDNYLENKSTKKTKASESSKKS